MKSAQTHHYDNILSRVEYNPRLFLTLLIWVSVAIFGYQFASQLTSQWMTAVLAVAGGIAGIACLIWPFEAVLIYVGLSICVHYFVRGQTMVGMGGLLVYPGDVFIAAFFVLEFFRGCMRQTHLYSATDRWVLAFFAWALFCLLRGIPLFGNSAIGEGREYLHVISYFIGLHFLTTRGDADKAVKWLTWIAVITSAFQLYNFIIVRDFAPRYSGGGPLAIFSSLNFMVLAVLLGRDQIVKRLSVLPIAAVFLFLATAAGLYFGRGLYVNSAFPIVPLCVGIPLIIVMKFILQYRLLASIALLMQLAVVLYSGQRASTIAVLATVPFLLWISRRHFLKAVLLVAISLVLFVFWISFMNTSFGGELTPFMEKQFMGIVSPENDPTASWRLYGWRWELEKIFSNPFWVLLGQGLGGYYSWYFGLTDEVIRTGPHNIYVEMWSKLGLLGLGLYFIAMLSFFRRGFRFLSQSQDQMQRSVVMILMLEIFGNLVNQMGGQFVAASWVLLAMGSALMRLWWPEQKPFSNPATARSRRLNARADGLPQVRGQTNMPPHS